MSNFLDESSYQKVHRNLVTLGLKPHEASVYIALLVLGQVGSSQIIKMTGLHGQYVYQSLYALAEKGFVSHVIINGRKKFSAKHPSVLSTILDQQRELATSTVQDLETVFNVPAPQQFDVFQGEQSYIRYEFQSLMNAEKQAIVCIIGGVGDHFPQIMGPHMSEYERIRKQKQITIQYLGSSEQKKELSSMKTTRPFFDFRVLPGLFTGLVNTNIWPDHVGLNLFGSPIVCFSITNHLVADSYRGFFNTLWEIGGLQNQK